MTSSPLSRSLLSRGVVLAAGSVLALGLTACGEEALPEGAGELPGAAEELPEELPDAGEAQETAEAVAGEVFGTECGDIPEENLAQTLEEPVGAAVEGNPELSTLADALGVANLGETLEAQEGVTLLAPTNAAFAEIDAQQLQSLLADPAQLTDILTYHVLEEQLTPEQLAGEQTTLSGETLVIEGEGEEFTIPAEYTLGGETPATVVCGNIVTANATLYLIDDVLQPPAG